MKKYTYKTKEGKFVYSDEKLNRDDLVLVREIRDGRMKSNEIKQK